MGSEKMITVIGGDLRQLQIAKMFFEDGYTVNIYGVRECNFCGAKMLTQTEYLDRVSQSDYIILPLPLSGDGTTVNTHRFDAPIYLKDIFCAAKEGAVLFGGKIETAVVQMARETGIVLLDYFDREELTVLNAIPTAEGAVQIAMEETPFTIHDSCCVITGYGRVAKVLSSILKAMGADVFVAARKYSDLAWIKAQNYHPVPFDQLNEVLPKADILFNTVPATVLGRDALSLLKKDCLILDLASKPGGVGFETAKEMGLKVIWALSLPGKVAPITSGAIIKESIVNMIRERGLGDGTS